MEETVCTRVREGATTFVRLAMQALNGRVIATPGDEDADLYEHD